MVTDGQADLSGIHLNLWGGLCMQETKLTRSTPRSISFQGWHSFYPPSFLSPSHVNGNSNGGMYESKRPTDDIPESMNHLLFFTTVLHVCT